MPSKILKCSCDSYLGNRAAAQYQNTVYGLGNRVHNPISKEPKGAHWRCSVCNNEKSAALDKKGK